MPFTCRYCGEKFCRDHHLPEKHECEGLSKEKWLSKKREERERLRAERLPYKKAYEVPGVLEVIQRAGKSEEREASPGHFDVDEKIVAAVILLLILILGVLSRLF
jgi:hypothetical protein